MKRGYKGFFKIILGMVMLMVFLAGCSKKETETIYEGVVGGVDITVIYYAKGDRVTKEITKKSVLFSQIGANNAEEAKEILEPYPKSYEGFKGIEETIEYTDDSVVVSISVDYSKVDLEKLSQLENSPIEGENVTTISLKMSMASLEKEGFKKVENEK